MTPPENTSTPDELAGQLARLARELAGGDTATSVVQMIVDAAVREIPGTRHAGVTLITGNGAITPAATDDLVERVDALQYGVRQGPCLDAASSGSIVRSDDLVAEPRWPEFGVAAAGLGVLSMLSFPLFVESDTFGALNLYAEQVNAFPPDAERIGALLAAHAAAAMISSRQQADLRIALDSRDLVGQAKGILMERFRVTGDDAFSMLVAVSQRTGTRLDEVARILAQTGELTRDRGQP